MIEMKKQVGFNANIAVVSHGGEKKNKITKVLLKSCMHIYIYITKDKSSFRYNVAGVRLNIR